MTYFAVENDSPAIPVHMVTEGELGEWLSEQSAATASWIGNTSYKAAPGEFRLLPDDKGGLSGVIVGVSKDSFDMWDTGNLARNLPAGNYQLDDRLNADQAAAASLGWLLGSYDFDRYKEAKPAEAKLRCPDNCDQKRLEDTVGAIFLVRDLINTPASDMGPTGLAEAANNLATEFDAAFSVIIGDDLLAANYPAVHAVGRAAADGPRLIDIIWGDPTAPKVTLVGKGVCFDTGGLDLKASSGMKLMKKDMGGAAHVLGLAQMIMAANLPVRLRVLIPAVENSVSANALRPLDVVTTRSGRTVEIGNTDAEGRVILADALSEAADEEPEIIIDYATLTGAARVALGTELPALFCNNDEFATALLTSGNEIQDPLWRLPLWPGYKKAIKGKTADLTNAPEGGFGGAITAALFLEEFVANAANWTHIDLMAWNLAAKPGRPEGGEAMSIRALFAALSRHYI